MALLRPGEAAPDVEGEDQHGRAVRLRDLRGRWVALYFYPADDTPGCTAEACGFRDDGAAFEEAGVQVIGVSRQDAASHRDFAAKHGLRFPLLPDPEGRICAAFGARGLLGMARRVTFLLDPEGRVARVWPLVWPRGHSAEVLAAARALAAERAARAGHGAGAADPRQL